MTDPAVRPTPNARKSVTTVRFVDLPGGRTIARLVTVLVLTLVP